MSDEEKKLAPDTPADTLHAHIENHIALPDAQKFENEPLMNELTSHPNLASHSIEKMYHHMMEGGGSPDLAKQGHAEPYSNEWAENLLKHPNAPASIKQDFVSKTFHPDNPASELHESIATSPHVNEDQLRTMADTVLAGGEKPHAYSQLPPSYFMNHFKKASQTDPESDPNAKEQLEKLGEFGWEGLLASQKHTPESLNQTIDAVHNNKYHGKYGRVDKKDMLKDLVEERPDLSKEHLNKIHQMLEAEPKSSHNYYHRDEAINKVLEHPNVDPSLLSKYSVGENAKDEALSNPRLPKESIAAFVRKVKAPNEYHERNKVDALLENPSITKETVKALIDKGSNAALNHPLADEADIRNFWNKSGKGLDQSRSILHAKNLPPDVLKELVNHKNQDVAVDAINHPKADMSVVEEGLKRKAKTVQDAARLHPLVAESQVKEGLKSGKTSLSKVYADEDFKGHFDKLPKADQEAIFDTAHKKYAGANLEDLAKKTKERSEVVIHSKYNLAKDTRVPEAIRDQNAKDLADMFKDKVGKNKTISVRGSGILSGDHEDDSHRLIRAVTALAKHGDAHSQHAILNNPAILQGMKDYIGKEGMDAASPSFLEAMYRKGKEYEQADTSLYDNYGSPKKFDSHADLLQNIFESKNTSDALFQEIATDPRQMNKLGEGDYFERYDDLPEDQQNQKYREILDSGSVDAAKSVVRAKAPEEAWDRAFSMLHTDDKDRTIGSNIDHIKEHRPDIFHNAAIGVYNSTDPNIQRGGKVAQAKALEKLSSSERDSDTLYTAMLNAEDNPGYVQDDEFMQRVPEKTLTSSPKVIDDALQANRPMLANRILGRRLDSQSNSLSDQSHLKTPEEKTANKQKADAILAEASARVQSMPSSNLDSDNASAENWSDLVDSAKTRYGDTNLFKNLKKAGISLDFLADMPGTAGKVLKEKALSKNLLSSEKLALISSSGSMDDVLAIGNPMKRQAALESALTNPNLTRDDLNKLTFKLNQSLLNPESFNRGRRKSMSAEAHQVYQKRLNDLIDLYQAKAPDDLNSMVFNATREESRGDKLTKEDLSRISKGVMDHVTNKAYATPADKNMAMYQVYKGLGKNAIAPSKMLSQVEKSVFESKDYDTMVKMAEEGFLSDDGMNKLTKVVAQPGTLNSSQIAGLSTQLDNTSEPQTVVNMAKTFEKKMEQELAQNPTASPQQAVAKAKVLSSLRTTFNPSSTADEEHKVKNEFVINYTKKAAQDPNPVISQQAYTNLLSMSVSLSSQDLEKSIDLMASLPDDDSVFGKGKALAQTIPESMANHKRFIEMAQSGWKLNVLAHNAEQLTGANASILTTRALDPMNTVGSSTGGVDKATLFQDLENNYFVQSEDSVKVARAMSSNDFNKFARDMNGNTLLGNITFAAAARLNDLEAAAKDSNLVASGAPHMGSEHTNHLMYNAHALSSVVMNAKMSDDVTNLGDKLSKVSEIINGVYGHVKAVAQGLRDRCKSGGYNIDIGRDQRYMLSIADNIANTGLQLDRADALKVIDMVKEFHSVYAAAGMEDKPQESYKTVTNIVQRAENFEDQDWRELFASAPHAVFHLDKRSEIPPEALNSVDYKMFEDHPSQPNSVQDAFTKTTAGWFNKMSQEDLATHGKNLMNMYVRMQSRGALDFRSYSQAMTTSLPQMARHLSDKDVKDLVSGTKDKTIAEDLYKNAVKAGAGGRETLHSYVNDYEKKFGRELFKNVSEVPRGEQYDIASKLEPITNSPHLDDELAGKVCSMFQQNPSIMSESIGRMLDNKNTPESAVKRMSENVLSNHKADYPRFDQRQSIDIATKLMSHPNVPEKELLEMFEIANNDYPKYFSSNGKFNPALSNPTHGGKLFRSLPIAVPEDVKNVDAGKAVQSISLQHKDYKRLQEMLPLIPAEGIAWAEFKRKFPQQEKGLPQVIKDVFMKANNKPVLPEAFAEAARQLDDNGKKYHLTFSKWDSPLQRHRGKDGAPNLVVQINNSAESEKELSQDPKLWGLYQQLLRKTNGIGADSIGLHPTTPHLVSWSRVDTDQGKDAWAIEEYQSDFAQKFRRNLKALISSYPSGASINGQTVTVDEIKKYAKTIDKHLEDWSEASMQAVIENAKSHGIKKLYMHGAELRGNMSNSGKYTREFWDNSNTKPQTVGFRKIYDENPRKFGFQECDYTDYPKHSPSQLKSLNDNKLSTKCWVMDLAPDEGPKRKRKA